MVRVSKTTFGLNSRRKPLWHEHELLAVVFLLLICGFIYMLQTKQLPTPSAGTGAGGNTLYLAMEEGLQNTTKKRSGNLLRANAITHATTSSTMAKFFPRRLQTAVWDGLRMDISMVRTGKMARTSVQHLSYVQLKCFFSNM
jgi:hypothetical protein